MLVAIIFSTLQKLYLNIRRLPYTMKFSLVILAFATTVRAKWVSISKPVGLVTGCPEGSCLSTIVNEGKLRKACDKLAKDVFVGSCAIAVTTRADSTLQRCAKTFVIGQAHLGSFVFANVTVCLATTPDLQVETNASICSERHKVLLVVPALVPVYQLLLLWMHRNVIWDILGLPDRASSRPFG